MVAGLGVTDLADLGGGAVADRVVTEAVGPGQALQVDDTPREGPAGRGDRRLDPLDVTRVPTMTGGAVEFAVLTAGDPPPQGPLGAAEELRTVVQQAGLNRCNGAEQPDASNREKSPYRPL